MKKTANLSLTELVSAVAAGIGDVARKPNINNYQPHEKQEMFHKSKATGRLYVGGNRSGKTVGGVCEDVYWARGQHPHYPVPPAPTHGRIITTDFINGANKIIIPQLQQWLPPSMLKNGSWEDSYNKVDKVLTLSNKSTIEIMSHEQPLEKFAGTPRHWLHVDEECPYDIFKESKIRLIDYNGRYWVTMTPVMGMTWIYDELFVKERSTVEVITVDIDDNPHLSETAKAEILEGMDEEDLKIRARGMFVPIGGLVLREFSYDKHVITAKGTPISARWKWYLSIDHGYNNPTAIYWHAVHENGVVITFNEHYRSEWTVEQHARIIRDFNELVGREPDLIVGDPAMRQRQAVTGTSIQTEYRRAGVPVAMANNEVLVGLDKMNSYFRNDKWFIMDNCPNLLKEIRKYKWKQYTSPKQRDANNKREEPQKKDDHGVDSCRYFFSFMPELKPEKNELVRRVDKASIAAMMGPGTTYDPVRASVYPGLYDPNFMRKQARNIDVGFGEVP